MYYMVGWLQVKPHIDIMLILFDFLNGKLLQISLKSSSPLTTTGNYLLWSWSGWIFAHRSQWHWRR
jgi:hypothetical protein